MYDLMSRQEKKYEPVPMWREGSGSKKGAGGAPPEVNAEATTGDEEGDEEADEAVECGMPVVHATSDHLGEYQR